MKALHHDQSLHLIFDSPTRPVFSELSPSALHRRHIDPFVSEEIQPFENKACDDYSSYRNDRSRELIGLWNPTKKEGCIKTGDDGSRYSKEGQRKIKKEIRQRLSHYPTQGGVFVTLTYLGTDTTREAVTGMSRPGAWWGIGYGARDFMDEVNKWRKRHGLRKIRFYIKVMEDQKARGYPAPHIWFPGLKWLANLEVLKRLWPHGDVDVQHMDGITPANYICKYITKMEGKDFMLAMMRCFHLRFFSTSRNFKYRPEEKVDSGWRFFGSGDLMVRQGAELLIDHGYAVGDQHQILDRGG